MGEAGRWLALGALDPGPPLTDKPRAYRSSSQQRLLYQAGRRAATLGRAACGSNQISEPLRARRQVPRARCGIPDITFYCLGLCYPFSFSVNASTLNAKHVSTRFLRGPFEDLPPPCCPACPSCVSPSSQSGEHVKIKKKKKIKK